MKKFFAALVMTGALVGCGVSDDAVLSDLEEGDWEKLCAGRTVEASTTTCEVDGVEYDVEIEASTEEDCVADNSSTFADCGATAGDFNACMDAFDGADVCSAEMPAACDPLLDCWG